MTLLDDAFEVDGALLINNDVVSIGVFVDSVDPSVSGLEAPIGSMVLLTDGRTLKKTGGGDQDWTVDATASDTYTGVISTAANIQLTNTHAIVLVDTTTAPVVVTLPSAPTVALKFIFVKWVMGPRKNRVQIVAPGIETIDAHTSITLVNKYDTLQVVSDNVQWWII